MFKKIIVTIGLFTAAIFSSTTGVEAKGTAVWTCPTWTYTDTQCHSVSGCWNSRA